jgi:hypothetical protein
MRTLVIAVLILLRCGAGNAQMIYQCPQAYPGKDAPSALLTGAFMDSGDTPGSRAYALPRDEAAEDGYDTAYIFADDEQAWLVCDYGARKRVKGRFHDGHEWNQRMRDGAVTWWIKLAPRAGRCNVQVREVKSDSRTKSTWTAAAFCKPSEP